MGGEQVCRVGELVKIHRWGPEFRWLACLEGGRDVVVSIVIAQSSRFLPNLDLSAALLTFYTGSLTAYSPRKGASEMGGFCVFTFFFFS